MSSGISNPPANAFPCPNCGKYDSVIGPVDANIPTHSIEYCAHCKRPYVVQNVTRVMTSVHKIEGIETPIQKTLSPKFREFVDSEYKLPEIPTEDEVRQDIEENTYICSECDLLYSKEDWCFEYGTCKRCAEHLDFKDLKEMVEGDEGKATHPDPEQYHCQECGCIYPIGYKETRGDRTMCSSCWATEDNQKAGNSQPELEYMNISGNVFAAISGETVHLKYNDNYLDAWNISIFDVLADMGEVDRRNEIDKLVDGMKYRAQRRTCLNQVVCALLDGDIVLGGDV